MTKFLFFTFIITFYSFTIEAQQLDRVKKAYQEKRITNPEKYLGSIAPNDPDFIATQRFLVNYYASFDDIKQSNKQARIGYKYSDPQSYDSYYFWDKFHHNEFSFEGMYGWGSPYNSTGWSLSSGHNYSKRNWLIVNLQNERRNYHYRSTEKVSATSLGLSHILVLDSATYIQSSLNFALVNSFFPNYSVDNEIFYSPNNNTYSFSLKYSSYDRASIVMFSPHWRYDWDQFFLALRLYGVYSEIEPAWSIKLYTGYRFNHRWKAEFTLTTGTILEDGVLANRTNFYDYSGELKYRPSEDHEFGLRYEYYKSNLSDQNKVFLNYLYKY